MTSISEIFDKDPLSYSKTDLVAVVDYFRQKRLEFKLGDKQAGAAKKIPGNGKKADAKELDLEL